MEYLSTVHRIAIGDDGLGKGAWAEIEPLRSTRSSPACQEVQFKWTQGIMVAGGYRLDGGWLSSVEFFNYADSKLI